MNTQMIYKLIAGAYDVIDLIYFGNEERSPRKAVLDRIGENDVILDLCTGTGTDIIRIAEKYPKVKAAGVDLSPQMLNIARQKADKAGLTNLQLYKMDGTQMKFCSGCFDKVLISLVLHETEDELAALLLAEARRVLKDDGELIVTEWERSNDIGKKLMFLPVELLEPKPFRKLICADMADYFGKNGFELKEYIHCDFSRVLVLRKGGNYNG